MNSNEQIRGLRESRENWGKRASLAGYGESRRVHHCVPLVMDNCVWMATMPRGACINIPHWSGVTDCNVKLAHLSYATGTRVSGIMASSISRPMRRREWCRLMPPFKWVGRSIDGGVKRVCI